QGLRRIGRLRQAVARYRAGCRPQPRRVAQSGSGRSGPHVRLCLRRNARPHAGTHLVCAPSGAAPERTAQRRSPELAAPRRQVTFRYVDGKPVEVDTVVLSTQHAPDISQEDIREAVIEEIIKPVIPEGLLTPKTRFLVNPTGVFIIGGPQGDCGLTGRKIIVDTYGGACPHGGGAFSGKDPSKVDRSAAYAARYVAKNVVAAGLARQCQVQVSYAIGVAEPINITVYTEGTGVIPDEQIARIVREN